jgi:hypothetical protein
MVDRDERGFKKMKKFDFKKISAVLTSFVMLGATMGFAAAANFPTGFTTSGQTAVVYGANSADQVQADNIADYLSSKMGSSGVVLEGGEMVTETEVTLGGQIDFTTSKVKTTLTDSDLSTLLDEKISWDDGNGADDYDIHEEIVIGDMALITLLNDTDLEGVALTNKKGLSYRYVFDDALNTTSIGSSIADTLYLTILGEEYEVEAMTSSSITVVTSEEVSVKAGESVTVDGVTFTVTDVYSDKAAVDGEIISSGSSKKINGKRVKVDSIGYHSNDPTQSRVVLRIGDDISKTYVNGDEYIGEDESDPLWVWNITDPTAAGGSIGVDYNVNTADADDDNAGDSIKYVGDSYILPNDFGGITFDGLTDVSYEEVVVSFDTADLYNSVASVANHTNAEVIVISAENDDSITVGGEETSTLYIYYANNGSSTEHITNPANGAIELFFKDADTTPTNRIRYETRVNLTGAGALTKSQLATIEVGETTMNVTMVISGGIPSLVIDDPLKGSVNLTIGGDAITNLAGTLERLGATVEDADAGDIVVNGTDVSTRDDPVMNFYGVIVAEDDSSGVEGNADVDEVTLSIPSDQVYGIVSASVGGEASAGDSGSMIFMDTESGWRNKNVVLVGGSCINSATAEALGTGKVCDTAWASATGVGEGKYLIQSVGDAFNDDKIALVVAGYSAEDTAAAAAKLTTDTTIDTTAGTKYIGVVSAQGTSTISKQ